MRRALNGADSGTKAASRQRRAVVRIAHGDEGDRHRARRFAEERSAPADLAEQAAEERTDRDAEAERRLVEDDGRAAPPDAAPDDAWRAPWR